MHKRKYLSQLGIYTLLLISFNYLAFAMLTTQESNDSGTRECEFEHLEVWCSPGITKILGTTKVIQLKPMREVLEKQGKKAEFNGQVFLVTLENEVKAIFKILPHLIAYLDQSKIHPIAIDNSGIRNHQHVRYGELTFIRVLYSDELDSDDSNRAFPFEEAKIIDDPSYDNLKKINCLNLFVEVFNLMANH